ncbi:MAG: GNAT family N-acetyltransferase [Bacteroidales bacterium]|nr:GNAT family N-acetyltransferase [Bacteroidales bacterium]
MDLNIRQISKNDNSALAKMIRGVFEEHEAPRDGTVYSDPTTDDLYTLFQKTGSILWVAEFNGEIAGCCGIYPSDGLGDDCSELVKFYVSKEARGMGIGKELMVKSEESARAFGFTQLYLESLPHFAKAVRIYEKQGYIKLVQPLGTSIHTTCNIWMLKKLF